MVGCSQVVVAMGPWSVLAEDFLNPATLGAGPPALKVPLEGVKSTSLVYNSEQVGDGGRGNMCARPLKAIC